MSEIERKIEAMNVFDSFAELTLIERAARLTALAKSKPDLAHELQRLLDADDTCTGILDRGLPGMADSVLHALNTPGHESDGMRAGHNVGAFTLMRPLGQGGMGEVWLAQRRLAQRDGDFVQHVALKILKRGMDSEDLVRRFVQERRILAELNHPHIARFIDGGISTDGRLYYAMEFVEGVSMLDYARQNKLDVRACVLLMAEVCDAVAHAQAHLVVHRDLKPSNILVDENAQPRVLDFGIAKLLDSSEPYQTATEMRAMTPVYAAPEQILGEPISTATDVYALGVILYQLLTGRMPNQRTGTLASLAVTVRHENIERPSVAIRRAAQIPNGQTIHLDQARAAREIAGDLDTVLLMALRREPIRRYANAAALGNDLRAWLVGMPVAAQVDTRGYRLRTFIKRNRAIVGATAAVFLALLIGLSMAIWQAGVAHEQTLQAQIVRDFFVTGLSQANLGQNNLTMSDWLLKALPRIDEELKDAPEAQAEINVSIAEGLRALGRHKEAIAAFETALKRLESLTYANKTRFSAIALRGRGSSHLQLGQYAQAELDLRQSLVLFDGIPEQDAKVRQDRLSAGTTLLGLNSSLGRTREALAIGQTNLSEKIAMLGADNPQLAVDYSNVGSMMAVLGRYDEAGLALARAQELIKIAGDDGYFKSYVLLNLINVEVGRGNLAQAREDLKLATSLRVANLGAAHLDTLMLGRFKVNLDLLQERPNDAESTLTDLLPVIRKSASRFLGETLLMQMRLRLIQGRNADAMAIADEMSALADKDALARGNTKPLYGKRLPCMRALAAARLADARNPQMQSNAKRIIEIALASIITLQSDADVAPIISGEAAIYLAGAFQASGQLVQAREWYLRGLQSYEKSMPALAAQQRATALVPQLKAMAQALRDSE